MTTVLEKISISITVISNRYQSLKFFNLKSLFFFTTIFPPIFFILKYLSNNNVLEMYFLGFTYIFIYLIITLFLIIKINKYNIVNLKLELKHFSITASIFYFLIFELIYFLLHIFLFLFLSIILTSK